MKYCLAHTCVTGEMYLQRITTFTHIPEKKAHWSKKIKKAKEFNSEQEAIDYRDETWGSIGSQIGIYPKIIN